MSNSYNSDIIIKQKLEGYEMDFPMEIWDNIDAHRSFGYKVVNKLKRNWYLLPVLLVGFSFLMFWWMSSTPNQQGLERASLATMAIGNNNGHSNSNANAAIAIETKLANVSGDVAVKEAIGMSTNVTEIASKNNLLEKYIKPASKSNNDDNNDTNFTQNTFVKVSENSSSDNNITVDDDIDKTIGNNISEEVVFENKATIENPPILNEAEEKKSPKKEEKAIPANLKELELAFLSPKTISTQINRNLVENAIPDDGCNNFGSKRYTNFMVDLLVGPDYSFKNLSLRSTEPTDYISLRKETESMVVGFSGQARFSLLTPSNIMLRSGVMFSQINERFEYEDVVVISTSEEPFTETVVEGTTTTIIEGTVTVSEVERNQIKSFNTYKSIDIPVLIGYHIDKNDMFFEVSTGVMANLRFAKKGKLLNNDLVPQLIGESMSTFDQNMFRDNIGLSLYGSAAIGYKATRDISFIVEPNVRYQFNPITEGTNQIIQKFLTTSLHFGARYHF